MEQVLFGIVLVVLGIASTLDIFGWVEIVSWFKYISPILVTLIGSFMILRVQGRLAARAAEQKGKQETDRVKKEMKEIHVKDNSRLTQELNQSKQTIREQDEVIDDLVNPKTPPQV